MSITSLKPKRNESIYRSFKLKSSKSFQDFKITFDENNMANCEGLLGEWATLVAIGTSVRKRK